MRRTHRFLALALRLRRAGAAPLPLLGLLAAIGPLALTSGSEPVEHHPAEVAYHALPALPTGSPDRTADGVESTAIALALSLGAVPLDALGGMCPADDLQVSWVEPGDRYRMGSHVTPIGPEPVAATKAVNGIVVCTGSAYAYMGFEARWDGDAWDVVDVPFVGEEEDEHQLVPQPAPPIPAGPKPVPVLAAPGTTTGPIEGYAAYEPQRTCDPTPKVGTRSLAGALLRDYTGSRNLGIVRGCSLGGRSEHKEGRAFDWGVNITNPNEKAAAQAFIGALMATDGTGNKHALARRMGVMYLIWDRQIWSAYRASEGWRPYSGSSPHRDHVHLSLSWAGANGRTSFWSGTVPTDLPTASPVTANASSSRGAGRSRGAERTAASEPRRGASTPRGRDGAGDRSRSVQLSRDQLNDGVRQLWNDGQPPTAAEIEAWLVGTGVSQEWASQYAGWAAERAARDARQRAERVRTVERDEDVRSDVPRRRERDDEREDDRDDERERRAEREVREREARQERQEEWARRQREAREAKEAEEQRRREERVNRREAEEARQAEERAERERREQERRQQREEQRDAPWPPGERRRGGWRPTPTTTVPKPTTTAPAPTTTAPPATTTTTPAPTTTTVAPTTTTAAPETTTTTTGG